MYIYIYIYIYICKIIFTKVTKKSQKDLCNCATLHYIEDLLILASVVTGCVSISTFASLVGVPVAITGSSVGLTLEVKKYQKNIKKIGKGMTK